MQSMLAKSLTWLKTAPEASFLYNKLMVLELLQLQAVCTKLTAAAYLVCHVTYIEQGSAWKLLAPVGLML